MSESLTKHPQRRQTPILSGSCSGPAISSGAAPGREGGHEDGPRKVPAVPAPVLVQHVGAAVDLALPELMGVPGPSAALGALLREPGGSAPMHEQDGPSAEPGEKAGQRPPGRPRGRGAR